MSSHSYCGKFLKERFESRKHVAHFRLIAFMAGETIVILRFEAGFVRKRIPGLLIRFHRSVGHLAGADCAAGGDGRISWYSEVPIERAAVDRPSRAGHDVIIANVGGVQHSTNIVVDRNQFRI